MAETITIDGVVYLLSELSEECRTEIKNLQFCEAEIARLQGQLAIAGTARIAYQNAVARLLPEKNLKH